MPLARYASECLRIAEEFQRYLQDTDTGEVRNMIGSISRLEWLQWLDANASAVDAIVAAAPAARAKALAKLERMQFLLMVLAARQRCLEAAELLGEVAEAHWVGNSYRSVAASAGALRARMADLDVPLYPWQWAEPAPFRGE